MELNTKKSLCSCLSFIVALHARLSSTTHDCIMFSQFAVFRLSSFTSLAQSQLQELKPAPCGCWLSFGEVEASLCHAAVSPLISLYPWWHHMAWIGFVSHQHGYCSGLSCHIKFVTFLSSFFLHLVSLFLFYLPAYLLSPPFFKLCFPLFGEKGSWSCGTLGRHRSLFKVTFTQTLLGWCTAWLGI